MGKKIKKRLSSDHSEILHVPHDVDKMGEIIMEYALPLLEDLDRWDAKIEVIKLAIHCWNLSFVLNDKKDAMIASFLKSNNINGELAEEMKALILFLLNRKVCYFSHINTKIADYEIIETGGRHILKIVVDKS
ncbi:hypothetical protein MBAV_003108 [Candidatus Magnetobacterium bavaricum]|uniref:Uncharacterized protein n=1 Tax=Candidatus Magnetobacterium bavaricum TaxID=29290 RepID=A0A0F3GRU8_9BACT|nr:hypothetical protein MBAV_003108 [Candidatus Magnetobacterium bavaricum]